MVEIKISEFDLNNYLFMKALFKRVQHTLKLPPQLIQRAEISFISIYCNCFEKNRG